MGPPEKILWDDFILWAMRRALCPTLTTFRLQVNVDGRKPETYYRNAFSYESICETCAD
jgi:hypothetical protein